VQRVAAGQLSLEAAPRGKRKDLPPLTATVSVSGKFVDLADADGTVPELDHGEVVLVTVSDIDGQLIAQGHGRVQIAFADKSIEGEDFTIREQKVKL